jgi:D-beta-D-heptose 7-phosphate kinase/D-beta-D-heptose 1-phosphate adenosyltransferase
MINKTIVVSGGLDPIHVGHVNMIQAAAQLGDVIVVLNSDAWLKRKKGYVFMPYKERKYLLEQLKGVTAVTAVDDDDETVCEALRRLRPVMFGNGGDRTSDNTPEMSVCHELGIEMIWNLGGEKIQSSSGLINTLFASKPIKSELDEFAKILEGLP